MDKQIKDIDNGVLDLGLNDDNSPDPSLDIVHTNNANNNFIDDINGNFVIDFSYAYSLRELFKLLSLINCENGTFIIRQEGILYVNSNANDRVITTINMNAEQFTRYEFSAPTTGTILLPLNIKSFYSILSKIAKKEIFRIYKQAGDNRLYYQILSDTKSGLSDGEIAYINPVSSTKIKDFKLPNYNRSDLQPNCVVTSDSITTLCKDMKITNCESMRFYFFPKGLHVSPIKHTTYRAFKFGEVDENVCATPSLNKLPITNSTNKPINVNTITKITVKPRNLVEEFNLHKTFVYALASMNNINPRGIVKFYAENNKPLRIVSSIGDYGTLQIFISKN